LTNVVNELKVIPVAGRIGAEVQGVKLLPSIEPAIFNELKKALNEYKVLFFRGQDHLDDVSHEAFSLLFGELYAHPTVPVMEDTKSIFELDSKKGAKANTWHTDVTFVPNVPKYSILRSIDIPDFGGDTVWANTNAAYEDLPTELKNLAVQLWAIHTNEFDYANYILKNVDQNYIDYRKQFESIVYKTKHPVVHVHRETGKRHLLLGGFAGKLVGLKKSESEALINIFQTYVTRLENTVRWKWNVGDVVIWDNLATQHYAIADYGNESRVVRRVTVGKHLPVNINGQTSSLIDKK
jgi:taurine dioxygenase